MGVHRLFTQARSRRWYPVLRGSRDVRERLDFMPASAPLHRTNATAWPRSVVDALPFAVAVLDPDGVIVESNRALNKSKNRL